MEMAYRERWRAEIAELRRILSGFERSPKLLAQGDLKGFDLARCQGAASGARMSHRAKAQHSTICWAVHSAVGRGVTATCRTRARLANLGWLHHRYVRV